MCVHVCVCGGGDIRTLYPMKVLQTHLKTYTVLSQLVQPLYKYFRFVWSIYLIQFGMPKGGGGVCGRKIKVF